MPGDRKRLTAGGLWRPRDRWHPPVPEPPVLSLLGDERALDPAILRNFLERLVEASATHEGLVVGEGEPGRYLLVMPPLPEREVRAQIDAGLDLVLGRLAKNWPSPHVTDWGLKESYAKARDAWLGPHGLEELVRDGKVGVVTIFCHDWV